MAKPETVSPLSPLPPYWRAARYEDEVTSRRSYVRLSAALLEHREINLSFTRLLLETGYHVTIVGTPVRDAVDRAIVRQLEPGISTVLSPLLLAELWRRHHTVSDFSPWLERHSLSI